MKSQPVHILLVEDDEIDAEAIVRGFQKQQIDLSITVVSDGIEAINALRGEGGYERVPAPYFILLDLNMPRMNGIEFLQALRQDPQLKSSIVFVLTTSNSDKDKLAAYREQIAGYLLKQRSGVNFADLVNMLEHYWRVVEFPPEERTWLNSSFSAN
ncbi:MAG: response regulator [Caldilineaceae bacterium]|nr:response regulator [Caldilineaceae bacterium]